MKDESPLKRLVDGNMKYATRHSGFKFPTELQQDVRFIFLCIWKVEPQVLRKAREDSSYGLMIQSLVFAFLAVIIREVNKGFHNTVSYKIFHRKESHPQHLS